MGDDTVRNDLMLLSLKDVSVITNNHIPLLTSISFSIYKAKILTIIGPNGAGKTTLLKTLLNLIPISSGNIQKFHPLTVGYLPQKLSFDYTLPLTVQRFLQLHPSFCSETLLKDPFFQEISISSLLNRFLYDLSGGELQRVLLIKALLNKPNLLILDEPTQGMDPQGQIQLYQMIEKVRQIYQCAIVLVSHDLHFVFSNSHQVICINKHICCMGHPAEIQHHPLYQQLWGTSSALAPYTHTHDHTHGFGSENDYQQ